MYNVGRIISVISFVSSVSRCTVFWVVAPGLLLLLDYRYMLWVQYVGDDTLKSYCPYIHLLHFFHQAIGIGLNCWCLGDGLASVSWWCVPHSRLQVDECLLFPSFTLSSWWLVLKWEMVPVLYFDGFPFLRNLLELLTEWMYGRPLHSIVWLWSMFGGYYNNIVLQFWWNYALANNLDALVELVCCMCRLSSLWN
jgi:hypothetical protein